MYTMNLWGEQQLAPEPKTIRWTYNKNGRPVKATLGSKRRCDSRCTSARGPDCECRCQGRNHGIDNNHWGNDDDDESGELFASDEER